MKHEELSRRDFSRLMTAAGGAIVAGIAVGCGKKKKIKGGTGTEKGAKTSSPPLPGGADATGNGAGTKKRTKSTPPPKPAGSAPKVKVGDDKKGA